MLMFFTVKKHLIVSLKDFSGRKESCFGANAFSLRTKVIQHLGISYAAFADLISLSAQELNIGTKSSLCN